MKIINWIDVFPDPKASFGALLNSIKIIINKVPIDDVLILTCPSCGQTLSKGCHYCLACGRALNTQAQIVYQGVLFNKVGKESCLIVPSGCIRVGEGTFMMGGNGHLDDKPIHQVTLDTFYMSKYQVSKCL